MIMGYVASGSYEHFRVEDSPPAPIKCAECMKEMQGEKTFDASKWMFDRAEVCGTCYQFLNKQSLINKI